MGIFDFVKKGAQELFIARPDEAKGQLVYKWPDRTIPMKAQITVGQDETALFYKDGTFVGRLPAGRHTLDTSNIPFLSLLMDKLTGGNMFMAEVWFVTTREMAGMQFGGKVGMVEDLRTRLPATPMVHGEYSMRITDPVKAIGLFGQKSWSTDEEFSGWFTKQLLKVIRDRIAEMMVKQDIPLLKVTSGAYTEEIEELVIEGTRKHLDDYGMRVVRLGNFNVVIDENDRVAIAESMKEEEQMRRARSGGMQDYQQYAAAKAMLGAGQGMAKGGGDGGGGNPVLAGAGLGVGVAMAQMFQQQPQQAPPPQAAPAAAPVSAAGTVSCPKCQARVAPGKFCAECGGALAEKKPFCSACGQPMVAGSKFCAECGAKQG